MRQGGTLGNTHTVIASPLPSDIRSARARPYLGVRGVDAVRAQQHIVRTAWREPRRTPRAPREFDAAQRLLPANRRGDRRFAAVARDVHLPRRTRNRSPASSLTARERVEATVSNGRCLTKGLSSVNHASLPAPAETTGRTRAHTHARTRARTHTTRTHTYAQHTHTTRRASRRDMRAHLENRHAELSLGEGH